MNNLKVMKLTDCIFLERTPNFLAHSKLERLILHGCYKLVEIDKSICQLKSLVFLDVSHCGNLRRLPDEIGRDLKSLKYLYMIGCNSLERLPNTIGNFESLIELDIIDTGIKELPDFIGNLKLLNKLKIPKKGIKELPDSIGNLELLIELDISESEIKELPDSIGSLESLIKLNISSTIKELPDSIGNLKSLNMLDISRTEIKELPDSIGNLESLIWLYLSESDIEKLPDSIGQLKKLKVVEMTASNISKIPDALWAIEKLEVVGAMFVSDFNGEIGNCIYRNRSLKILSLQHGRIYAVPRLPESLIQLDLSKLYMDTFPDLSNLTNLKELYLTFVQCDSDGESEGPVEGDPMPLRIGSLHGESGGEFDGAVEKDLPRWIGNLSKLESLILKSPYVTALPTDISLLPRLKLLKLLCPNLRCLPSLPSSLSELDLESECVAALPTDMSSVPPRLESLLLTCPNLRCLSSLPSSLGYLALRKYKSGGSMEGEDLSNLKTLRSLDIYGCAFSEIRGLDRLENLQQLRLTIFDCGNLVEIQGGLPPSLYELKIERCGSLQKLPDLSSLKELREVYIRGCWKLNVEAISSFCSEKGVEFKGDKTNQREKTAHLDANSDMDLREKTDR
ncbi:hypothetical protein EUGRSUZ_H03807 [Eucalyptus grandis]|uniref:Disease resistance R13L4/SHOC-2-like LRR domain-containing protein n=4 Tax=Eucalyptus grandis TaxID=71139 RepID=A0A059B4J1_EUCGR|nr:hypothetical protein EUGRSUZ_H03807 [Eucalyptus grandis]KAK3417826.1 hypothetical protein EUGRSUZ_H03807 [Eucalyptus grandis]KAK3417827.1 hypothetical protein EUGRSUZ_H03807 [Eucalyptus grandis]